ncbi:Uncharacterised protein [BD1-7 clade bacterium]|uniref:Uncharacterized protein n=1 Tax=BD1-7 clade bacterium TaxID=2029982 RepID=A0A5S9QGN7_9GAMM|nr:Uncharacterised protein [BD1-7 clade bacterium]CAA0109943.1 Uncharacterised protein [BD1-7 clade bacterium]CAA0116635.1 Uncharacterised protein [BD1-7 clade bacterium]
MTYTSKPQFKGYVASANGAQVRAYVYADNQLTLTQFGQFRGAYSGKNIHLNFDANVYEDNSPDFTLFEEAGTCLAD